MFAKSKLIVVGSGAQCGYVADILKHTKEYIVVGIADAEKISNVGKMAHGARIVCVVEEVPSMFDPRKVRVIVAHGNNEKKKKIAEMLEGAGFKFTTLISPGAYISPSAKIGDGSIVNPMAVVMPGAVIGRHSIIHSGAVIEHDNILEDYVNIGPGAHTGGGVRVGEESYIYTGASVIPGINLGRKCVVGAGAVVIRDVADGEKVVGNPARPLGENGRVQGEARHEHCD